MVAAIYTNRTNRMRYQRPKEPTSKEQWVHKPSSLAAILTSTSFNDCRVTWQCQRVRTTMMSCPTSQLAQQKSLVKSTKGQRRVLRLLMLPRTIARILYKTSWLTRPGQRIHPTVSALVRLQACLILHQAVEPSSSSKQCHKLSHYKVSRAVLQRQEEQLGLRLRQD